MARLSILSQQEVIKIGLAVEKMRPEWDKEGTPNLTQFTTFVKNTTGIAMTEANARKIAESCGLVLSRKNMDRGGIRQGRSRLAIYAIRDLSTIVKRLAESLGESHFASHAKAIADRCEAILREMRDGEPPVVASPLPPDPSSIAIAKKP